MMTLLVLRARLRTLYQKYELYIDPFFKFITAFIVLQLINTTIGYDNRLKQLPIVLALSLLSAFTPSAVLVLLAAFVSIGHIYFVSKILSVIIILIIMIMYLLFVRFTPRLGYVVVAIPILYLLKMPYLVPIVLGLFTTPISIVPTSCGVIIYYLFKIMKEAASMQVDVSIDDTLQLYTYVINSLVNNKQMIMSIIIFSLIIIVTYVIRRKKFDYAREIAIASGALTCILAFLISDLRLDVSEQIGAMILGTLISAIIAVVMQFFYMTLDYTGVEHVQFEDEDYYYYVKAVPKINVTTPQINVKRFNTQKNATLHEGLTGKINIEVISDDDDDDYLEYEDYGTKNKNDSK
ncbi:MAG: putative rane protein [Anaerocolumna sp.]|nr:putative rane protein [Anaerocolumna sp.]